MQGKNAIVEIFLTGCNVIPSIGASRDEMNAVKQAIMAGKTVVGTARAPNLDVPVLADAGYDFLLFDTQLSPFEVKQMGPSIQAMRGKKAAPMVRVPVNSAEQICFALDGGARGIVAPMVNTSAEAMVRACRYYPAGNRSNAGERGEWGSFKAQRDHPLGIVSLWPAGAARRADHHVPVAYFRVLEERRQQLGRVIGISRDAAAKVLPRVHAHASCFVQG